jgi:hypothetical protein
MKIKELPPPESPTAAMSITELCQTLPSVISDFMKTEGPKSEVAQPFVTSLAAAFSNLREHFETQRTCQGDGEANLLSEPERSQIHQIIDQIVKAKDARGIPLLATGMQVIEDEENVLEILRFLAENGFTGEVTDILLSEVNAGGIAARLSAWYGTVLAEIIGLLPEATQEYLNNVTYPEYGGGTDTNVYETYLIHDGTFHTSS